jgi:hypothetical protein
VTLLLGLLCLLLVACEGDGGGGEPTPSVTETPDPSTEANSPEGVLRAHVQATFQREFVADCAQAVVATDAGKVCATAKGERDNLRAYTLGQVASEGIQWVILQLLNGQWSVAKTQQITRDNAAVPGVPWPLKTGVDVVVVGADPCVNVRPGPGLAAPPLDCVNDGTVLRLSAGPAPADNLEWWQIEGRSGWIVSDYLRYPDAAQ